ncbi:DUF2155 domain-containing protein [Amaricoccus solimangrovi]|uniref:DUF2155 domain-containing protein n=1 Tax=Amaricoccus solimangrovi TaxID=2589815 RepID=A0A501WI93_9RHOB|nr:DUF2155 domain-containing protein [Amaricoccus solimangrovi]TPE49229.1 DUF2155 domain-containing protein [Amaricoccus solimangrovi]
MIRALTLIAALCAGCQAVAAQTEQVTNGRDTETASRVRLRALDTLDGGVTDLVLRVGETARFKRLEITAETCRVPVDDPKADAFAFLRIRDTREAEPRFSGWMLASSPALSALDHPRYDVWVVGCDDG